MRPWPTTVLTARDGRYNAKPGKEEVVWVGGRGIKQARERLERELDGTLLHFVQSLTPVHLQSDRMEDEIDSLEVHPPGHLERLGNSRAAAPPSKILLK